VALANKTARTAWALLARNQFYANKAPGTRPPPAYRANRAALAALACVQTNGHMGKNCFTIYQSDILK